MLTRSSILDLRYPLGGRARRLVGTSALTGVTGRPLVIGITHNNIISDRTLASTVGGRRVVNCTDSIFRRRPVASRSPLLDVDSRPHIVFDPRGT